MATLKIFETNSHVENALLRQQLLAFADAIAWLEQRGVVVERIDISANPAVLKDNPTIESLVEHSGKSALPVILLDGVIKLVGRYASRAEMSAWAKVQHPLFTFEDQGGACSGPQCRS